MPERQPKAAITAAERPLLEAYAKAWQRVTDLEESIKADPKRWRQVRKLNAARRSIEAELDRLDATSQAWFRNDFPRIYTMGARASARELGIAERQVFNALNPEAIEKLAREGFDELLDATRGVRRSTKAMIRSVIGDETLHKMIAGDTAKAAAKRATKILETKGVHAVTYRNGAKVGLQTYAEMAVRTKTAVAYNLGTLEAADSQGVEFWEIFDGICGLTYHDGPTANGMIVTLDTALANPISHPNAVLEGSSFAPYGELEEAVRAYYDGPALTVRTADGNETTIGPNHPMLTRRGMVRAKDLRPGDEILYDLRVPGTAAVRTSTQPNLEEMPRVEDAFQTLASTCELTRIPSSSDYLHGDGVGCQGEVEVVHPERGLLRVLDPCGVQEFREGDLVGSDAPSSLLTGTRPSGSGLEGVDLPAARGVRGGRPLSAHFVWVPVLSVQAVHFTGWAFDASTESSLYCSDGFVVSNCRRAFGARPDLGTSSKIDRRDQPTDQTTLPTDAPAPSPPPAPTPTPNPISAAIDKHADLQTFEKRSLYSELRTTDPERKAAVKAEITRRSEIESKKKFQELRDFHKGDAARRAATDADDFEAQLPRLFRRAGEDVSPLTEAKATNPDFNSGIEWQTNCTNAVSAFELRMRGFAVNADRLPQELLDKGKMGRSLSEMYEHWGIAPPNTVDGWSQLSKAEAKIKLEGLPDGARGGITVTWPGGKSSHIFSWIRKGGKTIYYDAQSGEDLDDGSVILDKIRSKVHLVRLDDKPITSKLALFLRGL